MAEAGLLAEFDNEDALAEAVRRMRDLGYTELEVHMPFYAEPVAKALGRPKSSIPLLTLVGGLFGAGAAYTLMWWTQAVDYSINVGGRPDNAVPAFIPITFETGVLFASLFTFFGWMFFGRMPKLWRPYHEAEGFGSANVDRFWIRIEASDARFELERTSGELQALSPLQVRRYGGEP